MTVEGRADLLSTVQAQETALRTIDHALATGRIHHAEEVRGPGVVGQQPFLRPGEHFEYTSGCVLQTSRGEMKGEYQMHRPDGTVFDADIAPFSLALPYSLN